MPQAIGAIVAAVEYIVGAFFYSVVGYVIAYGVVGYALNSAVQSLSRKRPGDSIDGRSLEVAITDTGQGGFAIYGKVRVSGVNVIPPITGGTSGQYLEQVLALALHEVDSYVDVYVDDTQIANANIDLVTGGAADGQILSGKYSGSLFVRRYKGTSTQTVDFILNNRYSSAFTSDFRGRGIAYAALTYVWGDGKLYSGIPVVTFEVKGKKCYDPRLDSSPGAAPTNPSFIAWTENPALQWADFAMSDYGGAVAATSIDWNAVVTAANVCDALVNIPGATTQKRYTFNGRLYIPMESDWRENAKAFVDAMMGRMVYRNGKWFIYAGAWDSPSYTIEKVDWLSIDRIRATASREDGHWNTVACWYVDPSRNWQRVECFRRRNSTYKSADGNEEIVLELEQPGCTNEYEAQRKAEFLLRQSRNQVAFSGKLPPRFRKVVTGDTLSLNFSDLGWTSKTFRVRGMSLNSDGSVDVQLIEEQDTDWTDLLAAEYNAPSSSTIPTTNPTTPSAPSSFALDTFTIAGTLLFKIGPPATIPRDTRYQIIRGDVSTNAAVGTVIYDSDQLSGALAAPSSFQYYWSRAYASSYFGPYQPNTTGISQGPLVWKLQQNSEVNSYSAANLEIRGVNTFTPDARGTLTINATIQGKATFDGDSGTSIVLCCGPTTNVDSFGIAGGTFFNTSSFDGGIGASFSSNSVYAFISLEAQFSVSSGVPYTYGVHCYKSFGSLTFRGIQVTNQFVRT